MISRKIAVLIALVLLCPVLLLSQSDVMFLANPAHTNVAAAPLAPKFKVKWQVRGGNKWRSTAAVFAGTVFAGNDDGTFYAFDAATGARRWTFSAGCGRIASSPAVSAASNLVYFACESRLVALDLGSGKPRLILSFGPELPFNGGWDYYLSSPVLASGIVYIGACDGNVYAVDAATGARKWTFTTAGRIRSTPAVANGTVYVGSMDGTLYALDAISGALKWKFKTHGSKYFPLGEIQSSPAIAEGIVVFGSRDGNLYAVDAASGSKKWSFSHEGSWVISPPSIADGVVYVGSSDGKFIQALDLATGKEKWRTKMESNVFAAVTVAGDRVYAADWYGVVAAFDRSTGKMLAAHVVDGPIQSTPVLANGLLYIGSDNDVLYALE